MDAIITKAGIALMLNANRTGVSVNLTQIKISSVDIDPTGDETDLTNIVYTVPSNLISKSVESSTLVIKVRLDKTIGTFAIGTFGIYTDTNVLFAVAAFPGAGSKIAQSLPGTLGNDKTFYITLKYDDLDATVNLTVGDPMNQLLVKAGFPAVGVTVTARQMRLALSTNLGTVASAVAALAATNAVRIGWECASPITKGDVISEFIRTTLSYTSGQIDALFNSALLQTP